MRPIDADALKEYICSICDNRERCEDREQVCSQIAEIDEQPTIEVKPVKHGRWINYPECLKYEGALDEDYFVCSECHHVWNTIDNCAETFRCCPNCGVRMDGDDDGKD